MQAEKDGTSVELKPLAPLPSLDEQVYEALLDAILSSKLEPGAPLVESTVAKQLGVSKTPVRAALQRLENELFIKRGNGYRYSVAGFTSKDVRRVYLVRSRLEGLVAYEATPHMEQGDFERATSYLDAAEEALERGDIQLCVKLGRRFHQLLSSKIDNEFLADSLRRLNAHVERGRRLASLSHPVSLHSVQQHKSVLQAMRAGDRELAEQRMQAHIMSFIQELQEEA
jgi:DNA-binding GntR family transcriptional regulator